MIQTKSLIRAVLDKTTLHDCVSIINSLVNGHLLFNGHLTNLKLQLNIVKSTNQI